MTEHFTWGAGRGYRGALEVGLVNNMPDAALRATELQFARLLKEAAGTLDVRLRLFSMNAIPRSEQARARMEGFYDDAGMLPHAPVDALIITGAEPRADDLRDEPYWAELAHLVDWAEIGTVTTLFSCLAAHAAVLHLDGIVRRPLRRKLSGVFTSIRVEDDPLFFSLPDHLSMPHSRRNEVAESDLVAHGYRLLARLANGGGADIFTREPPGHSRFVFLQGHPEYDGVTLGREYLRDLGRFLRSERPELPAMPENYFDRLTQDRLNGIAAAGGSLMQYEDVVRNAMPLISWRGNAVRLFSNWLATAAAAKARRMASRAVPTRRRA